MGENIIKCNGANYRHKHLYRHWKWCLQWLFGGISLTLCVFNSFFCGNYGLRYFFRKFLKKRLLLEFLYFSFNWPIKLLLILCNISILNNFLEIIFSADLFQINKLSLTSLRQHWTTILAVPPRSLQLK